MLTANEASIRDFKSLVKNSSMPPVRNEQSAAAYQQQSNGGGGHVSSAGNLPVIQQKIMAKTLQTITAEPSTKVMKPKPVSPRFTHV